MKIHRKKLLLRREKIREQKYAEKLKEREYFSRDNLPNAADDAAEVMSRGSVKGSRT